MKLEEVAQPSGSKCEHCGAAMDVQPWEVQPQGSRKEESTILLCAQYRAQADKNEELNSARWRTALPDSKWSELPGVQARAWRMLNRLRNETWAAENLDMLYLDEERLAWAEATDDYESDGSVDLHKDSNGAVLQNGDTIVLTQSLDVKGSMLNVKMGTVVKNIRLVENNTGQIEGQVIVILTK